MFKQFFEAFSNLFSNVHPVFLFSFIIVFGLYIFWRGCIDTRKNNSSIFDLYILSTIMGLVVGRISYVITRWEDFSSYIWYWLPYEKYGDEIFLFRVLPWRFFRIWDWGIDVLLMFVGFLITASLLTVAFKRWRWDHLFTTIFFTAQSMLAMSFLVLGTFSKNLEWVLQGAAMVLIPFILFILKNSVRKVVIGPKERKILILLDIFFILISLTYTTYIYLSKEVTFMERYGIYVFCGWTVLGIIVYLFSSRKDNVTIEKVSSVNIVSPVDVNQPIKLYK